MITTRYKPLFSVSVSYQQPDLSIDSQGLTLGIMPTSQLKMADWNLIPVDQKNISTTYYKGLEQPAIAPLTSEPINEIVQNEVFYYGVKLIDKALIPALKFHSTPAVAKAIGFPLLFDAKVNAPNGPGTVAIREDVKVIPTVFTYIANAAATGITGNWATLEITDENNNTVDIKNNIAPLNDKQADGIYAVPEFAFSVDMSSQSAGIYKFKVGNVQQLFFIPANMVIGSETAIIRILKNNNLSYHKSLADSSFTQFSLIIAKA